MIDPRALALHVSPPPSDRRKAPRHKSGERFLRGPIPMPWLCAAARAAGQGRGFQVAIALWFLSGLNHQARTVRLSSAVLREFGVDRHAGYRGLKALEMAGLVRVDRHAGRLPRVTILGVQG
jgi:hypothetical protein